MDAATKFKGDSMRSLEGNVQKYQNGVRQKVEVWKNGQSHCYVPSKSIDRGQQGADIYHRSE